ncbi:MAG: ribbon-helix-helix domain-containing protein [Rickettsiales bacterium]|jgi:predicted DNA-binding ribbon-helix-helix protein|nr:ribbon-helix-helix domain-containing protein [Rickettsiales bacterium]
MKKISISISGHRTSLTLESEFIGALRKLAAAQKKSTAELVREIDEKRGQSSQANLSSAVRVYILKQLTPK